MVNRIKVVVSSLMLVIALKAGASEHMLKSIGLAEGLSQSSATCMVRDARGFLWIGTGFGLNRYDNSQVRNYFADGQPGSIPDNAIQFVSLDPCGDLLVGCDRATLRYDYCTDTFEPLPADDRPMIARSAIAVSDGTLLGGYGHLYKYNSTSRTASRLETKGGSDAAIRHIEATPDGNYLLLTHWDGLWLYNHTTDSINRLNYCSDPTVRAMTIDSEGRLWASPFERGIEIYSPEGELLATLSTANSLLSNNIVLAFEQHDGKMWIATEAGIDVADLHNFAIEPLDNRSEPVVRGTVVALVKDNSGNMLVGTLRHGMVCIYHVPMRTFTALPPDHRTTGFTVTSMMADPLTSDVWIGIDGDGVALFSPDNNALTHYPSTAGMKVTGLTRYTDNTLLLAEYRNGLWIFNPDTGRNTPLIDFSDFIDNQSGSHGPSTDLFALPDGRIAAITDKILTYDPATHATAAATFASARSASEKLYPITGSTTSNLLLYDTRHIYRYSPALNSVATIYTLPPDIGNNIAATTIPDGSSIWITDGNSLHLLDPSSSTLTPIETHMMHNITALVAHNRRLWIGADNRLYLLAPDALAAFGTHEGVAPNQFINKATLVADSCLLMGGVNGLLKVDLADIYDPDADQLHCDVTLSDIVADGRRVAPLRGTDRIDIPANPSSVTLRIIDHDRSGMRNKLFRFTVTGNNHRPISIETFDRQITLNMLPAGTYRVSVQYSANNGTWSTPSHIATLHVQQPWYATWWALLCYALLALAAALVVWRFVSLRRRSRVAELRRRALQDKVNLLTRVHRDLRTPLALVTAPLQALLSRLRSNPETDSRTLDQLSDIYSHSLEMREAIDNMPETYDLAKYLTPDETASTPGQRKPRTQPPTGATHNSIIDKFDTSALTALVVEGNEKLRNFIVAQLQSIFKQVSATSTAHDGALMVRSLQPDIVVVDTDLPDSDGFTLCHHIKAADDLSHIPVLLLTTGNASEEKNKSYAHGADSYISKPFDIDVLINRCKNLLHNRSMMRRRYGRDMDLRQPGTPHTASETNHLSNSDETFALKLNHLIATNIAHPDFGVEFLAKKMAMSRTSFYNRTRRITGRSIGQLIADYRLERARTLLTTTRLPISEIAEQLGFRSARYFSSFFKEKTGTTPSDLRQ